MNLEANALNEAPIAAHAAAPLTISGGQKFYWSVRRELWESRSIYLAPLVVAGVFLGGFVISLVHLPGHVRSMMALSMAQQHKLIHQPYEMAETLLMATMLFVAILYSVDALHAERKDRSVLFWKSLPVSDWTTVLAKASVPILILPTVTFAIIVALQLVMLIMSSMVLSASGVGAAFLWQRLPIVQMSVMLFMHLIGVHGIWNAPFYAWMILVSAWARRAVFLWAVLPGLAIVFVERVAFGSSYFVTMLLYQLTGGPGGANFLPGTMSPMPLQYLGLNRYLTSPGLWLGLLVTAACLAAAVQIRHKREPL
jgi:ABC-2 type transport system permease protein